MLDTPQVTQVPAQLTASIHLTIPRAMRVVRAVYRGRDEGLDQAWRELNAWVAANGHTPAPDLLECYAAGPESSPDPAMWRTALTRPLLG